MANRMVGNVLIVDSAAGNAYIINTLVAAGSSVHFSKFHVNAVAFWSSDTTGRCIIAGASTANHLVSFGWVNGGAGFSPATQTTAFGQQQPLEELKIPTLTSGTAWLYFT